MPQQNARIEILDLMRGIALFGILLVNIFVFHAPIAYFSEFYGAFEGLQAEVLNITINFSSGKFLFLFAFLFGYSAQLQKQSKRENFKSYFTRRMLILFGFGCIHILLFWFGDILSMYAILGILLLPFLKLPNNYLLLFSCLFLLFRPIYYFGIEIFYWPAPHMATTFSLSDFISTFQEGNYLDILKLRYHEYLAFIPEILVWYLPKIFGVFLLGVYSCKIEIIQKSQLSPKKFLLIAIILFAFGGLWLVLRPEIFATVDLEDSPIWRPIFITFNVVFETLLSIAYIIGILLVYPLNNRLIQWIASAGRMALSNYFLQSLLCITLFYGFGFGFYAKLNPYTLIIITLSIYLLNLILSHFYLQKFNRGPLEYLWRWLIAKL